jgi:hypothetical protein
MSQNVTLYGIEADLLELICFREGVVSDEALTDKTRKQVLAETDLAIKKRTEELVRKVDGAAFYVREFSARAAAAKAEKERNAARQRMWESRLERLEEYIKSVMLMSGKSRLDGDSNTLKLVKCPPSVEITQPELVPDECQNVVIKMTVRQWEQLTTTPGVDKNLLLELERVQAVKLGDPVKSKIAEVLKQQIPCGVCGGTARRYDGPGPCPNCNGTGKVNQGVPGCSLVTDKLSLRVE